MGDRCEFFEQDWRCSVRGSYWVNGLRVCGTHRNFLVRRGYREDLQPETAELLNRLETWCEAYPPDIFPPPAGSYMNRDGDYDTEEKRGIITKASAAMGRHMIERAIKPAIAEIRRLAK